MQPGAHLQAVVEDALNRHLRSARRRRMRPDRGNRLVNLRLL